MDRPIPPWEQELAAEVLAEERARQGIAPPAAMQLPASESLAETGVDSPAVAAVDDEDDPELQRKIERLMLVHNVDQMIADRKANLARAERMGVGSKGVLATAAPQLRWLRDLSWVFSDELQRKPYITVIVLVVIALALWLSSVLIGNAVKGLERAGNLPGTAAPEAGAPESALDTTQEPATEPTQPQAE